MKKLVSILLVAVMLCGLLVPVAWADTGNAVGSYGDYDKNGKINANDALSILKISVGKLDLDYNFMRFIDVNNDFKVNASDALDILRYSVGKIKTFKAYDTFTGTVDIPKNHIYLQQGGTASLGVWCESPEAFEIRYESQAGGILQLGWDSCGWIYDGKCAILNISALISVTKETVIPINIFYVGHTSVYEVMNVHLIPEQAEPFSYGTFAGIPDMGDYMKTAPEWIQTEVVKDANNQEYFTSSLCYDAKTILSNGNGGNAYQTYIDLLNAKLTLVSEQSRDDGYIVRTYKNDKFTIMLWLQEVDGSQKVFVYLQGKTSDV